MDMPLRRRRPASPSMIPVGARDDARQGARGDAGAAASMADERPARSRSCIDVARRLEGMARHASVHAAGVVIAPRPLTELVPLYKGEHATKSPPSST
ncbi:MAG: hypothetical protein MZU95_12830 [Desulfomicrobium escambiense]|nr:hypothetical protein [Desulfomicrobium escambiense]